MLAYTDRIERTEPVPDKETDDLSAYEIGVLPLDAMLALLYNTRKSSIIDILQLQLEPRLGLVLKVRQALYDLAKEAANERLVSMPLDEQDAALNPITLPVSRVGLAHTLRTTQRADMVDLIQQRTELILVNIPEVRQALFDIAHQRA